MVKEIYDLGEVINLLEMQFKTIDKRLSRYEKSISYLIEKLEKERETIYQGQESCEIRIKSYLD